MDAMASEDMMLGAGVGDGVVIVIGEGLGVGIGVGVREGMVTWSETFQIHVCISVPFIFVAIAEMFHVPTAGLVFV